MSSPLRPAAIGPVFAATLMLAPGTASAAFNSHCDDLRATVRSLGISDTANTEQAVSDLHACALAAVPRLIDELEVIDPELIDERWQHMIWCERALRSMTGQYFRFRSREPLGRLQEYRSAEDDFGYVTEHMSNGHIYVAPRDVQAKVIAAWKSWQDRNPRGFIVREFVPFGDWYF